MPSIRRRGSAAGWLTVALAAALSAWSGTLPAQEAEPAPDPKPKPVEQPAPPLLLPDDAGFELKPDELARLQKYLPNALPLLQNRESIHIVALGDSVTRYVSYDGHMNDTHRAYEGVFAAELAKLFFYTGGVRDIRPWKDQPAKVSDAAGPEITIENMGLGGRVSRNAMARVSTDAFVNKPSLMIISYGINDAFANESLTDYLWPFERSAEIARAKGCDPIFVGPNTTLGEGADLSQMERTRPYASALESLANRLGVFYFDFGTVTSSAPGATADQSDEEVMISYNEYVAGKYHTHGDGTVDPLHPSEAAHRIAGHALYDRLLSPVSSKYRLGGFVTLDGKGGLRLQFKIKNLSDGDVSGRIFTPAFLAFATDQASLPFTARAGKGQELSASFQMSDGGSVYHVDGTEAVLRIPLLVVDGKESHAHTIVAELHPFAPVWKLDPIDGLSDKAPGGFTVAAPAGKAAAGSFSVTWAGETDAGSFTSGRASEFSLPLPKPPALRRRGALALELKNAADNTTLRFDCGLEVSRNFGLEQAIPMVRQDEYAKRGGGAGSREVTFRASADAAGLTLVHEIALPLRRLGTAFPYFLEFHIDARAYGKRRGPGFTDFVRIIPLDDGTFKINSLRPSVFGDGYDKRLDRSQIGVARQPLPSGGERLTVTIPRSFFHLHEWALGNGNSLVGINTFIYTQSAGSTINAPYAADGKFSLVAPGMSRFNAQALGVLELTERPTKRWSARFY